MIIFDDWFIGPGTWGGGKDHNDSIRSTGARTITCKLPKQMLPVVVGDDGKIVADIARYSNIRGMYLLEPPPPMISEDLRKKCKHLLSF